MVTSDIIAGIALIISVLAWWQNIRGNSRTRLIVFRSAWDQVREHRATFWPIARRAYASFLNGKSDWPKDIDALIGSASMPPSVPIKKPAQIRNWYDDNWKFLDADKRRICEFVVAIYPPRSPGTADVLENSIIAPNERKTFDDSRRQLATYFHRQRESTSNRQLYKAAGHAVLDVTLISWLELALVRGTGDERPGKEGYQGKWGLFDFGNYLHKRRAR